jgi:Ca2+-binding EF-hand superfamily protein
MLKIKIAAVTALVLGTVGLAAAQPGFARSSGQTREARKAMLLEKFDTNRDGVLDPAEKEVLHQTFAKEAFTKLDTNGDGTLSFDEFKAGKHGGFRHHGRHGKRAVRQ